MDGGPLTTVHRPRFSVPLLTIRVGSWYYQPA
jgi:hypothetical protein